MHNFLIGLLDPNIKFGYPIPNNDLIASRAGNPVVRKAKEIMKERYYAAEIPRGNRDMETVYRTGPLVWEAAFAKAAGNNDICYPPTVLHPVGGSGKGFKKGDRPTPFSTSAAYLAGTWLKKFPSYHQETLEEGYERVIKILSFDLKRMEHSYSKLNDSSMFQLDLSNYYQELKKNPSTDSICDSLLRTLVEKHRDALKYVHVLDINSTDISEKGFELLLKAFPSLECLLANHTQLTNDQLKRIAKSHSYLGYIDHSIPPEKIDKETLLQLVNNQLNQNPKKLNLSVYHLQDKTIQILKDLLSFGSSNVEQITLNEVPLSKELIALIASPTNFPKLKKLDLIEEFESEKMPSKELASLPRLYGKPNALIEITVCGGREGVMFLYKQILIDLIKNYLIDFWSDHAQHCLFFLKKGYLSSIAETIVDQLHYGINKDQIFDNKDLLLKNLLMFSSNDLAMFVRPEKREQVLQDLTQSFKDQWFWDFNSYYRIETDLY